MSGSRAAPARHRPAHAHQPGPRPAGYCGQDPLVPCCAGHPAPGDRALNFALIDLDLDVLPGCLLPSFGRQSEGGVRYPGLGHSWVRACTSGWWGRGAARMWCFARQGRFRVCIAWGMCAQPHARLQPPGPAGSHAGEASRERNVVAGLYRLCRCDHYSCSSACCML